MNNLQHPDITRIERDGPPEFYPRCPECGEECEELYVKDGLVIGCDQCMEAVNAWKYLTEL